MRSREHRAILIFEENLFFNDVYHPRVNKTPSNSTFQKCSVGALRMTADFQGCVFLIRAAAREGFDVYEGIPVFLFKFRDIKILRVDVFPAAGSCQFCRRRVSTAAIQMS